MSYIIVLHENKDKSGQPLLWENQSRTSTRNANLELDKSSVTDGETNSQGDNACYKTSSVSNDSALINISSLCGERSDGSGESSNGGGVVVALNFLHRFWKLAGSKGLDSSSLGGDRGEGRGACHKDGDKDKLKGLHYDICFCNKKKISDVRRES